MKNIILYILILLPLNLLCFNQVEKLKFNRIFGELYPNNRNFESKDKLVRKVSRDGAELTFKTEIGKIFYYSKGGLQKALVILYSFDYSDGQISECHACFPEIELATFAYTANSWKKIKFVENWSESTGTWGQPPTISLKKYKGTLCFEMVSSYSQGGEGESFITYYDIETFKKLKEISEYF